MNPFVFLYRVSYADTDQMKVAYYANYFIWFERSRTEWLRSSGLTYKDLETKGIFLPVIEARCSYHRSVVYDDELSIITTVADIGKASIAFEYRVMRGDVLLAVGYTKHPFVNIQNKPIRIPEDIRNMLMKNA